MHRGNRRPRNNRAGGRRERAHRKMVWDESFQQRRDELHEADKLALYNFLSHKQRRDMLVCCLMLWGSLEQVQKTGKVHVAPDIMTFLERSAQLLIHRGFQAGKRTELDKRLMLMKCTEDGHRLARETGAEDARGVALATAYLVMRLVDSGTWADPDNQVVYVSLGILEEAERDGKHSGTDVTRWPWFPDWLAKAAFRMEQLGRLQGYF